MRRRSNPSNQKMALSFEQQLSNIVDGWMDEIDESDACSCSTVMISPNWPLHPTWRCARSMRQYYVFGGMGGANLCIYILYTWFICVCCVRMSS